MKINLLNTAHGLIPMYDADHDEKKKLKIGEEYQAEIKQPRNIRFHNLYFALINCTWEYLNERQVEFFNGNKEVFRKSLEVAAGHCDKVFSFRLKEWVDVPKSVSFSSMDEHEFRDLYDRVKDVIFNTILKDISIEEFNKNLINF
jgi:hypothetical protein